MINKMGDPQIGYEITLHIHTNDSFFFHSDFPQLATFLETKNSVNGKENFLPVSNIDCLLQLLLAACTRISNLLL